MSSLSQALQQFEAVEAKVDADETYLEFCSKWSEQFGLLEILIAWKACIVMTMSDFSLCGRAKRECKSRRGAA
jgi:hypothetical protein